MRVDDKIFPTHTSGQSSGLRTSSLIVDQGLSHVAAGMAHAGRTILIRQEERIGRPPVLVAWPALITLARPRQRVAGMS
ncbi:hypothetical protein [Massilia genomosp. 1]|uniref:hypothetical protein n=1 Tax=Massilia genomosp. 1 TaxID=2609280 RepID=UPI00142131E1|nr:hypothetical protein [Massilia genomosp. 1]